MPISSTTPQGTSSTGSAAVAATSDVNVNQGTYSPLVTIYTDADTNTPYA